MAELDLRRLNELSKEPRGLIEREEALYKARVSELATTITRSESLRAVLIAGPSGSGKTTSANLIKDAVRSMGEDCFVISLDDFYKDVDSPDYPKDEYGKADFESPLALDIPLLRKTLSLIERGESYLLPRYDFKSAKRVEVIEHAPTPEGCVIIEGLHALNPLLGDGLDPSRVMKLFISVSTNINDGERLLSGRKVRFVRRLVRDSIFRGADADKTLALWQSVLRAEDVHLYPFKQFANMSFDTFHTFELGVMKRKATELLSSLTAPSDYSRAVLNALSKIDGIDPSLVPEDSLIREFIGGGIYEEIY